MEYFVANFKITCQPDLLQTARDLLADAAGEAGFESFEDTEEGLEAYVQKHLFNKEILDNNIANFPLQDTTITYTVKDAENKDWNETWEKESFLSPTPLRPWPQLAPPPIGEGNDVTSLTIIPYTEENLSKFQKEQANATDSSSQEGKANVISPLPNWGRGKARQNPSRGEAVDGEASYIFIDPRLAFGTGTHETTQMIVSTLLSIKVKGKRVLDCGCGTGILSIAASKLGAKDVVAYDIDEWSVENTRHNAELNDVDNIDVMQGDASILNNVEGQFDIVLANINRNILLHDMPAFKNKMKEGESVLILSGFYEEDIPLLENKAKELGLSVKSKKEKGQWRMLLLE